VAEWWVILPSPIEKSSTVENVPANPIPVDEKEVVNVGDKVGVEEPSADELPKTSEGEVAAAVPSDENAVWIAEETIEKMKNTTFAWWIGVAMIVTGVIITLERRRQNG